MYLHFCKNPQRNGKALRDLMYKISMVFLKNVTNTISRARAQFAWGHDAIERTLQHYTKGKKMYGIKIKTMCELNGFTLKTILYARKFVNLAG